VAGLWFDDAVSVNVNLSFSVTDAGGPEVIEVVEGVLRKHSVDGDVRLTYADDRLTGDTPYPLIISRFYAWHEEFEADLTAAVTAVAPSAHVELAWDFPDEP
jgi:hypothetical protein